MATKKTSRKPAGYGLKAKLMIPHAKDMNSIEVIAIKEWLSGIYFNLEKNGQNLDDRYEARLYF